MGERYAGSAECRVMWMAGGGMRVDCPARGSSQSGPRRNESRDERWDEPTCMYIVVSFNSRRWNQPGVVDRCRLQRADRGGLGGARQGRGPGSCSYVSSRLPLIPRGPPWAASALSCGHNSVPPSEPVDQRRELGLATRPQDTGVCGGARVFEVAAAPRSAWMMRSAWSTPSLARRRAGRGRRLRRPDDALTYALGAVAMGRVGSPVRFPQAPMSAGTGPPPDPNAGEPRP